MRVFLDTNVLAAALATRGLCADVLREVLSRHEMLTCEEVLEELERALRTKFEIPAKVVREALRFLRDSSRVVPPAQPRDVTLSEEADARIVSAAVEAGAEAFVTGDREIQHLQSVDEMQIHSPRAFWEEVQAEG